MTREEAINTVRNIYQTDKEKEALATLIPEFSESDDERIRKEIIEYLKLHDKGENDYAHAMFSKWFNWLEKQKGMDNSYTNVIFPFKAMVKENGKIVTIHGGQLSCDNKWEKYQSSSEDGFKVYNPDEIINIKEMLSYTEKQKEQSITANDLDEEIHRFFDECIDVHEAKLYGSISERVIPVDCYELTARHFAKWGATHLNTRKEE